MKKSAFNGVNLGGWLVVEKWMTPNLFKGSTAHNEYELVQTDQGKSRLTRHHESFISEADFMWLNEHGVTAVRLPVGYWVFGDEPPYIGAIERVDWAFAMAKKYGMHVLLDLHGAPGAQNAADHSGSGRPGLPVWLDDDTKQERTIRVLERFVKRYNDHPSFWGIELINEPLADRGGFKLIRFYRRSYKRLKKMARPGLYIVFSDGFKPLLVTGALGWRRKVPVAIDCHLYQCFGEADAKLTVEQHLVKARKRRWLITVLKLFQPVIVGEWSGVLPWELLRSLPDAERKQTQNRFMAVQRQAYNDALGWFYWNYKTEKDSGWNFRSLIEKQGDGGTIEQI
jgi:glucan 1,3-beta-glucosidase